MSKGKLFVISGASGVGKSTLANILLRFYEPQEGEVLIDGQSLSNCSYSSIRQAVGIVNQENIIFDEDIIKISAVTALGSSNDRIEASTDGKRTEIGFNNRFMLDALRSCETDEVLINLNGPLAPAIILPPEGDNFLYLILPVRIKND